LVLRFTKDGAREKWLKTGIEFYNGKPYVSTVGTDQWSDWSVVLLDALPSNTSRPSATIEARREKDQLGKSLWVYQIISNEKGEEIERRPLREINWVFAEEEGWSVGIGGMVARPTSEGENDKSLLEAEFQQGVTIEVLDYTKKL
jgi:regulation of enolase protein 1 (concanavalin A-like superfamily)